MSKNAFLLAGVMTLGLPTIALAQTHYDPTPEHIYYYGPVDQPNAQATPAQTAAPRHQGKAKHSKQPSHAARHAPVALRGNHG